MISWDVLTCNHVSAASVMAPKSCVAGVTASRVLNSRGARLLEASRNSSPVWQSDTWMTRTSWDRREARVAVSSAREILRERRRWERSQARRESRKRGRMDEELSLPMMAAPRKRRTTRSTFQNCTIELVCLMTGQINTTM
jgi:hypothetical protein